jgi:hypothetical protein
MTNNKLVVELNHWIGCLKNNEVSKVGSEMNEMISRILARPKETITDCICAEMRGYGESECLVSFSCPVHGAVVFDNRSHPMHEHHHPAPPRTRFPAGFILRQINSMSATKG